MSYQEDLILSIYGRGEPGLAMADPLPKDDPNRRVPAPGKDGVPSSPYLPGKSPMPSIPDLVMDFQDAGFGEGGFVSTEKPNIYINSGAEAYILEPNGNFKFDGMYDPKRHGKTFPGLGLVQRDDGMKIAKKKRNEQRAYEDFVRDSQNMPLDESFKDLRRGQDGEGLDILRELLDLDEAKNNLTDGLKIANLPYQDGRVPNHLYYNNPYPDSKPNMFIIDQQEKEDARKRFKLFTGIDLATHDKGPKTPPAYGDAADVIAGPLYKRLMLGGGVKGSTPKNPYGL